MRAHKGWKFVLLLAFLSDAAQAQLPSATTSMFSAGPVTAVPQQLYATIGAPSMGDFDGDGMPDIVAQDTAGPFVIWHRNLGGGQFTGQNFLWLQNLNNGQAPTFARFVDLDRDGILDVVVQVSAGGGTAVFLRRPGTAQEFAGPLWMPPPPIGFEVVSLDFQPLPAGGAMAIIRTMLVPAGHASRVDVYSFDSTTTSLNLIGARDLPGMHAASGLAYPDPIDNNHDGVMDILLAREVYASGTSPGSSQPIATELLLLEGVEDPITGGLSFPNVVSFPMFNVPSGARPGMWKDVNGDGWGDYVIIQSYWVMLSDGNGGFLPAAPWAMTGAWGSPGSYQWADFNIDGNPDYVDVFSLDHSGITASSFEVYVTFVAGTHDPMVYAPQQNLLVYAAPFPTPLCCITNMFYWMPVGLADLDNDGDLDVAFVSFGATNSSMEAFGVALNDTIMAKGCSFSGPVPAIDVGPTLSGHSGRIGLRRASPGDQAYLLVSTGAQSFAGCGGMIPDLLGLIGPQGVFYSATVSDAGTAGFSYTLPPSATPLNFALFMQWVVIDAANPLAVRLSDLRKVVFW